jgi:hypothetical protein
MKRMKKTLQNVEFIYPHLDKPYKYDAAKERDNGELGKSVECEPTAPSAAWSTDFEIDKERGIQLYKEAEQLLEAYKRDNKSVKKTEELRGYKEFPDRPDVLRFRAKSVCADSKTGEIRKPPTMVGADLKPIENRDIYTGSKGAISFGASVTLNGNTGAHGVTFWLNAVQVTEPLYSSNDLDGFVATEKTYDNLEDFLSDTERQDQEKKSLNDLDDEIPF